MLKDLFTFDKEIVIATTHILGSSTYVLKKNYESP